MVAEPLIEKYVAKYSGFRENLHMKILIISDIHANLAALKAAFDSDGPWDEVWCLGDTIVAGPHPNEVLDILRQQQGIFLLGNHDMDVNRFFRNKYPQGYFNRSIATAKKLRRFVLAQFHPPREPNPDRIWFEWTCQQLSEENRRFLARFEKSSIADRGTFRIRLIHGFVPREWGHGSRIWPDSPDDLFLKLAEQYSEDTIIFGNAHVQYRKEIAGKTFICVGGLGQPRLGKTLAAFVVLTEKGPEMRSVPYDTEATAQAMDRVGLEDAAFVEEWKKCFRTATLPPHYKLRDEWESLKGDYI